MSDMPFCQLALVILFVSAHSINIKAQLVNMIDKCARSLMLICVTVLLVSFFVRLETSSGSQWKTLALSRMWICFCVLFTKGYCMWSN